MQRENNNTVGGRKPVGVMNALMAYSAGLRDAARVYKLISSYLEYGQLLVSGGTP